MRLLPEAITNLDSIKALIQPFEREGESGWQGSQDYKYKEWYSPDGKRQIVVTICGGPEYAGTNMKDIRLVSHGKFGGGEMMRVQAVIEPGSEEVEYNVYLDVITKVNGVWLLANISYFAEDNGYVSDLNSPVSMTGIVKGPEHKNLTDDEFDKYWIPHMMADGIYHVDEIVPEIDIEATVIKFIEQIKKLDFSKPVLVPKHPSISEVTMSQLSDAR